MLIFKSSNELDGSWVDKTFCDWTECLTMKDKQTTEVLCVTSGYIDVSVKIGTYKDLHMFCQETKSKVEQS